MSNDEIRHEMAATQVLGAITDLEHVVWSLRENGEADATRWDSALDRLGDAIELARR